MAFLQQPKPNDPNNQQNPVGGAPVLTSGGSGVSAGGQQNTTGGQTGSGNQFSNLQKLMNLNQNAPNTAAKVGQNVQQGQQTVQNNVSQNTQNIGQAYNYDPNKMANQVNNNEFDGLKQQLATTYEGPKAGSINVGPQNLGQVGQQTAALGSQAGQQQLLQQQYGKSDYTRGQQRLDSFLQSRNGDFQQQAAMARNQGKQLQQSAANQNQALNQKAASTEKQTTEGVAGLRQGLGNTGQKFQTDAQTAADAANQQDQLLQAKVTNEKNDIANGSASAETLAKLGYNPANYTFGVNLGDYIGYKGNAANANNIMSKDNYNRFKNINQLLGNDNSQYQDDLAGTYQQGEQTFDALGATKAMTAGQNAYDNAMAPQRGELETAQKIMELANQRNYGGDAGKGFNYYQNEIAKLAPGAVTNGYTRNDWVSSNLQSKQAAFNAIKAQLESQYLKKVGVKNG